MADLAVLQQAIGAGDRARAAAVTQSAIDDGIGARAILDAMTETMRAIGLKFQANEIFVPEMLVAARAMKEATSVLEPILVDAGIRPIATAVIGTVKGDLHDIGKNLVAMMWRGANIRVIDLGTNVPPERFAKAARENGARFVGASALLTTTMVGLRDVVTAVRNADLPSTGVIIGGAPVTAEYAREVGADLFAGNAASAVEAVLQALAPGGSA